MIRWRLIIPLTASATAAAAELSIEVLRVDPVEVTADNDKALVEACKAWSLSKEQVVKLRETHAIYMADSGRFNVIGMADDAVDRFIAAVVEAMNG